VLKTPLRENEAYTKVKAFGERSEGLALRQPWGSRFSARMRSSDGTSLSGHPGTYRPEVIRQLLGRLLPERLSPQIEPC
jgi:hypothetical protein